MIFKNKFINIKSKHFVEHNPENPLNKYNRHLVKHCVWALTFVLVIGKIGVLTVSQSERGKLRKSWAAGRDSFGHRYKTSFEGNGILCGKLRLRKKLQSGCNKEMNVEKEFAPHRCTSRQIPFSQGLAGAKKTNGETNNKPQP